MPSIRTVLCPVDFSAATVRQVDLAADLCRAFGARLILQHNQVELAIGSGVGWMWAPEHGDPAPTAEQRLLDLMARVPQGTRAEVRLTHGAVADAIMATGEAVNADLVVMSTRGETDDGDRSITERVLQSATLPVLVLHEGGHDQRAPRFSANATEPQPLLVATDLTAASGPAVDLAFDLSRQFGFDVHLLHVLARGGAEGEAAERARRTMASLVSPDMKPQPVLHVQTGKPARAIARVADQIGAVCIVMGEHERTPLRHWFRPDATQAVLHPARCPIWYVPRQVSAAQSTSPSAPRRVDALQDPDFHYWPSSQLYGVVDSLQDAELALADLVAAGVPEDRMHTWHGQAGTTTLDPTGRHHGRLAQIWRTLEKATPERELLQQYSREIEQGHVCIGVRCGAGQGRRVLTDILRRHHGHLISYFSMGSVERLSQ